MLWIGELFDPLFHERVLHMVGVEEEVDIGEYLFWRQLIHLPGDDTATLLDRLIGGWRIGFDVRAGEDFHILPGRVARLLGTCAGENDLLFERQVFIRPKIL